MGKLEGRCLCGNVTYTCDADPIASANCHCHDCQKSSGGLTDLGLVSPEPGSLDVYREGELADLAVVRDRSRLDQLQCRGPVADGAVYDDSCVVAADAAVSDSRRVGRMMSSSFL